MKDSTLPEATVIIGNWSSRCNSCGLGASPDEGGHFTLLGYPAETKGKQACGIKWTHRFWSYHPELGLEKIDGDSNSDN